MSTLRFTPAFFAAAFCLLPCSPSGAQTAKEIIPADSAMATANPQWQRLLLNGFEADSKVSRNAHNISSLGVSPAPASIGVKCGGAALSLHGTAAEAGAKGDFNVIEQVPGNGKFIGLWIYRGADANFNSVGIQIRDNEDELLISEVKADWDGWKWVEFDLGKTAFPQAFEPQNGKNKKIDFPLKGISVVWLTTAAGPTNVTVDGLIAVTELSAEESRAGLRGQLIGAGPVDFGKPLAAQYSLTNYTDQPLTADADFSLQIDSRLAAPPVPDPYLGSDEAIGTKSWTDYEGKILEEGSLTDGIMFTDYKTPWKQGSYAEVSQFVDLGKERNIIAMKALGGDVNWIWKVDVSASADGKDYKAVPDLQGVDFHGRWGGNLPFPIKTPFNARFMRFRYHNDGAKSDALSTFAGISIYDGIDDEKLTVPVLGKSIFKTKKNQVVPPKSFVVIPVASPAPLQPGSYAFYALVDAGKVKLLDTAQVFAFPDEAPNLGQKSRFGENVSMPEYAPILRRLGIGWIRFENMKWPFFSSSPGSYNFSGGIKPWQVNADEITKTYTDLGLNVIPMMFMVPKYASSAGPGVNEDRAMYYPPKDNAVAADYFYQAAARFGKTQHPSADLKTEDKKSALNGINYYEVGNEENLNDPGWGTFVGTMDQYYEMFRPVAEAIKKADPTAMVMNGGFSGTDVSVVDGLVSHKYADGKCPLDFVDVLSVHYYSGRIAPEVAGVDQNTDRSGGGKIQLLDAGLRDLVAWRDKHKKGLPIWMTETGYDSDGPFGTNERLQAARLPRVIMIMLANGVEKVIVYRERGSVPSMHSASGVIREDNSLKPSYFTYGTLIRQMQDAVPVKRLYYPDPNVWLQSWKRGKDMLITAWSVQGPAKLDVKIGKCLVTDAFGNAQEMDIPGNFPLQDYPVYISNIADYAAVVATLDKKEAEAKVIETKENDRLAKLKAYLFDFGTKATKETLAIGTARPFTPVSKDNTYQEGGNFGFVSGPMNDETEGKEETLQSTLIRMGTDAKFVFKAAPGLYHLRLKVTPFNNTLHVTVTSGSEKIEKNLTEDNDLLEGDIEVKNDPITVSMDIYSRLRWMTLVEKDAKWEAAQKKQDSGK